MSEGVDQTDTGPCVTDCIASQHNNHHAFPTSARHGLGRWQVDLGGWVIAALERSHLAWDVIRISPERQEAKRESAVTA